MIEERTKLDVVVDQFRERSEMQVSALLARLHSDLRREQITPSEGLGVLSDHKHQSKRKAHSVTYR